MNHARATVLATLVGVVAMLGPWADAGALFVPVADSLSRTAAVAGVPTERLVRVARNELASVRSQVTNTGAGRLLLNVGTELNLEVAVERTAPTRWGYSLSGRIDNPTVGFVTLVVHDEAVAGAIWTPNASYEITHVDGGVHTVRKVATGVQCREVVAESEAQPFDWLENGQAGEENTVVDVLVVWTQQREEETASETVRAVIDLGIAYTNDAFERSGVFVSLNLVGAERANYDESDSKATDLNRLADPSDGHMDAVHRRRDALGADLVSLAIARGRGLAGGHGIAYVSGAFSVSDGNPGVVAHEFGHNFGLLHERLQMSIGGYEFGYASLRESLCISTIMAYGVACRQQSQPRVPLFSSPVLFHTANGARLGVSRFGNGLGADGPADAVLYLNRVRNRIARFKPHQSLGSD